MGMFDDIHCEVALLPGEPKPKTGEFQTKKFACLLEQYEITVEGLFKEGYRIPYTGDVIFYTYEMNDPTQETYDDWWYEYQATFIAGKLEGIKVLKIYHRTDNSTEYFYPEHLIEPKQG